MIKLFVMVDVATKTNIPWRGQRTFLIIGICIRSVMRVISPVAARTISRRSIVVYPSFFFEINGNREVS